jgi:hypothetical protein
MKTCVIPILTFIVLISFSSPIIAQWNAVSDVLVFTDTETFETTDPYTLGQVLSDKNGGAWVLWHKSRHHQGIGDSSAIYLQHLDTNGYIILPTNGLRLTDSGYIQVLGDDFVSDDGTLHIAYRLKNPGVLFDSMYIQKITTTGTKVFGPSGIKLPNFTQQNTNTGNYYDGMIASTDSCFLIAYTASGIALPGIYIQKFNKDAAMLFGDTGRLVMGSEISGSLHFNPRFCSLNSDGKGGAFITYINGSLPNDTLWMQWLKADGTLHFSEHGLGLCTIGGGPIPTASSQITVHSINGGGFALYTSFRLSQPLAASHDLTVFSFDSLGNRLNGENGVSLIVDSGTFFPQTKMYPDDDGSLVYFFKYSNGKGPVYARKVSLSGDNLWGGEKYIGTNDSLMSYVSTSIGPYGFIGIWDFGDSSTTLHAQMIDGNGNKVWQNQGIQIGSGLPSYRFNPLQDRDQFGNCIACWNDSRNYAYPYSEIYCAKIDTTGFLPTVVQKSVHFSVEREISVRLFPNPAQTLLSYVISEGVNLYRVTITDELGRQIWEGTAHSGKIDIRSFGKGTYFLSIESNGKVHPIPFIIY